MEALAGRDQSQHATWPQSWIQRENWEFETHTVGQPYVWTKTADILARRLPSDPPAENTRGVDVTGQERATLNKLTMPSDDVQPTTLGRFSVPYRDLIAFAINRHNDHLNLIANFTQDGWELRSR